MRKISLIIIHCSAVGPNQTSSAKEIDRWHKAQGWSGIGYHYVIRRNGQIEWGRPEEQVGAHCKNHNKHSIGICYEGGLAPQPPSSRSAFERSSRKNGELGPADTRTEAQKQSLLHLLRVLKTKYPNALIVGHNTLSPKPCPCFDAVKEYKDL